MKKLNFKSFREPKVTDENGTEVIKFEKAKAIPTRECISILNSNNEKVGSIEKIRSNFGLFNLPKVIITVGEDKIEFQKDIQQMRECFEIEGGGISINGNVSGPEFSIIKNEKEIALINIQREEGNYLINIIDEENEAQAMSIVFVISWIV